MITASDAVLAAVGFIWLGAVGHGADRSSSGLAAMPAFRADRASSPDPFSAGEPYFEAVAAALRRTGYLDSWPRRVFVSARCRWAPRLTDRGDRL